MRKPAALLISVLLLFAAASCGSSDDSTSTTSTKASGATTTPDDGDGSTTTDPDISTTDAGGSSTTAPEPGSGSKNEYNQALAKGFASGDDDGLTLPPSRATCVAPKWIDVIGVDELEKKGVNPSDLEEASFGFNKLELSKAQATKMIDAFGDCRVDIYGLFLKSLASDLSDAQTTCLRRELTPTKAKSFLVGSLASDTDSDFLAQLTELDKKCKLSEDGPGASTPSGN